MKNTSVSTSDGFTFLEVLVSLSIMAIVLVAVFKLHAQSITMNNAARFHATAPLLMEAKLAEIKTTPLQELGPGSGEFGENYPGYTWQFSVEDIQSESLGAVAERLKQLNLTVTFGEDRYQYKQVVYHLFN